MNLAVLASYNGSMCKALLEAKQKQKLDINIKVIITNNKNANVKTLADKNNIDCFVIDGDDYDNACVGKLREYDIDYVFLSGYLKKIGPNMIKEFDNKIINNHPSLLPKFGGKGMYGINVHRAVIQAGEKISGTSLHLVDDDYDTGHVLMQKSLKVDSSDDEYSLESKIKKLENLACVELFAKLIEQKRAK